MKRSSALAALVVAGSVGAACGSSNSTSDNSVKNLERTGGSSSTTVYGGTGGGAANGSGGTGGGLGTDAGLFTCNDQFTGLTDCGSVPTQAEVVPVHILIVLDKSGSMSKGGLGSNQTKWQAVTGALRSALPQLAPYAWFGLELFPRADIGLSCGTSCCALGDQPDVAIDVGTTTVPKIVALLDPNRSPPIGPGGNTPTANALTVAYQYFQNHPISVEPGATQTGKQLVFLVTDGGPNCNPTLGCGNTTCTTNLDHWNDPPPNLYDPTNINWCDTDPLHDGPGLCLDDIATKQQITNLRSLGVGTVVIGIPGSEPYQDVLNSFADAGGQPNPNGPQRYYQVTSSADQLTQVFIQTATQLITSCNIFLEQVPPDPAKVNVAVDCAVVSQTDGSGTQQWSIDTTSLPAKLVLQGALCDRAQGSGLGRVDVLLGCPSVN
jgi:hypothetical protein